MKKIFMKYTKVIVIILSFLSYFTLADFAYNMIDKDPTGGFIVAAALALMTYAVTSFTFFVEDKL